MSCLMFGQTLGINFVVGCLVCVSSRLSRLPLQSTAAIAALFRPQLATGKHAGKTIKEVLDTERSYVQWLVEHKDMCICTHREFESDPQLERTANCEHFFVHVVDCLEQFKSLQNQPSYFIQSRLTILLLLLLIRPFPHPQSLPPHHLAGCADRSGSGLDLKLKRFRAPAAAAWWESSP